MHGGAGFGVGHVPLLHLGVNDPVVGAFEALHHAAAQVGQGITEHRAARGGALEGAYPGEAVGSGREALEEMAQQLLVVVLPQDVEHEAIVHLQQRLDGPVFGYRHREAGGLETCLAHPAGHHR